MEALITLGGLVFVGVWILVLKRAYDVRPLWIETVAVKIWRRIRRRG